LFRPGRRGRLAGHDAGESEGAFSRDQLQLGLAVPQLPVARDRARAAPPKPQRGVLRAAVQLRARCLPGGRRRADGPDPRVSGERTQRKGRRRQGDRGLSTAAATQRKPFVGELLGRSDYAIIGEIVESNTMVLDLGCGEGELLEWLAENKGVDARGVEMS